MAIQAYVESEKYHALQEENARLRDKIILLESRIIMSKELKLAIIRLAGGMGEGECHEGMHQFVRKDDSGERVSIKHRWCEKTFPDAFKLLMSYADNLMMSAADTPP